MPVVDLLLAFTLSALTVIVMSPTRLPAMKILSRTVDDLLPLVGTVTVVGVLVQIMALSGARGLISLSVVILPLTVLFAVLWAVLPISEGIFQYASAPLLGVPLVFLFNMKGINPIIALSGMATIWPLGDCLPPTAPVGRAAVMTAGFKGDYKQFLVRLIVPALFILALGTSTSSSPANRFLVARGEGVTMQTVQTVIGFLYYVIAAVIGLVIIANFMRTRDAKKMLLYAVVLIPFVLRVLRIK